MAGKSYGAACLVWLISTAAWSAPLYPLHVSPSTSQEGFLSFSWQGQGAQMMEIAKNEDFGDIYQQIPLSSAQKVHLSGFHNGLYYARLVDFENTVVSKVTSFEVAHRELSTALALFAAGGLLFIALLTTLISFSRKPSL